MSAVNTDPPTGDQPAQQPKMVPESELLKVKGTLERRLKNLETQFTAIQTENQALKDAKLTQELSQSLEGMTDAEGLKMLRTQTYNERLAIAREKATVEADKARLAEERLTARKLEFAKTHNVPEEVMTEAKTEVEAELMALRYKNTNPQPPANPVNPASPPPGNAPVDTGSRGGSAGAPKRTPAELIASGINKGEIPNAGK